jgi:hypothetical protein
LSPGHGQGQADLIAALLDDPRDRPLFNASMDRRLRDAAAYPKL